MTNKFEEPTGFETRLLGKLIEVDAARAPRLDQPSRPARRTRWTLAAVGATTVVAFGGVAAAASGVFDSAPPQVQHTMAGLDGHGQRVGADQAVRIGVIDDHIAYAAPTSGGGFCLYFADNQRSGPSGGNCIDREAAPDEAVFSVLVGNDGGLVFGRVGTAEATQVRASFPITGGTATAAVAASGFFAVPISNSTLDSMSVVTPPDPAKLQPQTKDGGPIRGLDLDLLAEISVTPLDGSSHPVGHGVYVLDPDLAPQPTDGPLPRGGSTS